MGFPGGASGRKPSCVCAKPAEETAHMHAQLLK